MDLSFLKFFKNTIIAKYLMYNILVTLIAIFTIISLVIFGNQLVSVIKESLTNLIPTMDLMPLIGFKMLRDIPLIVSLSLFLAIILSISKLYKNSEAVVINSMGLGDKHFVLFIQPIVISVFIVTLLLTTIVVPWSKYQKQQITDRNKNTSEFLFMKHGEFQEFKNGDIVFYASKVSDIADSKEQQIEQVFIYALINNKPVITLAAKAQKYIDSVTGSVYLRLKNGRRYFDFPSDENKKILDFDTYDLQIVDGSSIKLTDSYTKIEGLSTFDLLFADDLKEIAELQWRISQPLSVLILSALGVLLGKTSPRGGKNLGVLIGIAIFILYNNLLLIAKSSLEQGGLSAIVGLWWVHLLMIFIIIIFYFYRYGKFSYFFDKILHTFLSRKINVK